MQEVEEEEEVVLELEDGLVEVVVVDPWAAASEPQLVWAGQCLDWRAGGPDSPGC